MTYKYSYVIPKFSQIAKEAPILIKNEVIPQNLVDKTTGEAIAFAEKVLKEKDYAPFIWKHMFREMVQPQDVRIAKLYTALLEYDDKLKEAMCPETTPSKEKDIKSMFDDFVSLSEKLWNDEKIIQLADDLMKLAYVISRYTIEDIPAIQSHLEATTGIKPTACEALGIGNENYYTYKCYFTLPLTYHKLRGQKVCKWHPLMKPSQKVFFLPYEFEIPAAHSTKFYTDKADSRFYKWRILFNDYCDRVEKQFTKKDLNADKRYTAWIEKDLPGKKFILDPDTTPN